jgi:hypothetical protein
MGRTLTATVTLQPGVVFTAGVHNLTPVTLFLATNEELHFREIVHVHFNGVQIAGEIALVSRDPKGALIVFQPSPTARALIDELIAEVEVLEQDTLQRATFWDVTTSVRPRDESHLPTTEPMGVEPIVMDDEPEKTIPDSKEAKKSAREAQMTRHDVGRSSGEASLAIEKRSKTLVEQTDIVRRGRREEDITELDPRTLMDDE